jgi:uroporphyrinogen decarboxylase
VNSRERTFLAVKHRPGDKTPIDFWATRAVARNLETALGQSYEEFLDYYEVDLRYIQGPRYIGPALDEGVDIWGVRRSAIVSGSEGKAESYSDVLAPPLGEAESAVDVEKYAHWPDPDMFDYSAIENQCDAIRQNNRIVVFMGDRLNRVAQLKPAMYLRGTENIFLDLALRPEMAGAIFRKIRTFYLAYLDRILRAARGKIDIVLTGDDFGAQNSLLVGAPMWREFLKPGFAEYISVIKHHAAIAMHHTCGSVFAIIPDMIECGLDILQSIQPEAAEMALAGLRKTFGSSLTFHGGISIQKTMPYGSAQDIRNEVRRIANLIKPHGGYIFCTSHNIQADTPVGNIVALMEAYREYRQY